VMPSLPGPALDLLAHWSPRAAVRGFLDAAKADDEKRMRDFATESSEDFAKLASILDDLKADWSVGDDFVEGEMARVKLKRSGGAGREAVAIVRKEEGGWRVDLVATGIELAKSSLGK